VKRLVLLSSAAMMLAATVFAPVAVAQEPGDIDIQSVTLGTGGTAIVTGTFQCAEGMQYYIFGEVRQTTGNRPYNVGSISYPDENEWLFCQAAGPETFTTTVVGQKPFKKGDVLVYTQAYTCDTFVGTCEYTPRFYEELRIR
jgi:hypothetical protein